MVKEYSRTKRVGDQVQKTLAQLIQQEINDPRLTLVTLTAVKVSKDLSYAAVYFTSMLLGEDNTDNNKKACERVLNNAAGYLRLLLAKQMKLRSMPQLKFHYDQLIEQGVHLESVIRQAVAEDQAKTLKG